MKFISSVVSIGSSLWISSVPFSYNQNLLNSFNPTTILLSSSSDAQSTSSESYETLSSKGIAALTSGNFETALNGFNEAIDIYKIKQNAVDNADLHLSRGMCIEYCTVYSMA